jgi:hypothetical protein
LWWARAPAAEQLGDEALVADARSR